MGFPPSYCVACCTHTDLKEKETLTKGPSKMEAKEIFSPIFKNSHITTKKGGAFGRFDEGGSFSFLYPSHTSPPTSIGERCKRRESG